MNRDELDDLIYKHEHGEPDESSIGSELKALAKFFVLAMIVGFLVYTMLAGITSWIQNRNFSQLQFYGQWYSGYGMLFTGLVFAISYLTGKSVMMGEMARRAWTNSKKMDETSTVKDYQKMMGSGYLTMLAFFSSIFVFIFYNVIFVLIF